MSGPDIHVDLHLVLLRDGSILMGERRNVEFGAGQYHVPAGHLEADETIIDGIIREAAEETSIVLAPSDLDLAYVMHFRGASDRLSLFFTASNWTGEIETREPDKCAGWQWLKLAALPANIVPYARQAIADLTSGKRIGLFGWPVDEPIPYMARTRAYYRALGYDEPYRWAHFADAPFAPLGKKLRECRIGLVTTAVPYDPARGEQGPGAPYNAAAKFHRVYAHSIEGAPDVRISHVTYDRTHTTAEDSSSWFPLAQLKRAAAERRIGSLSPRFYGAPTTRSQRSTLERDAPDILAAMRADGVDAAVLVPNCPICHQTIALIARQLEAAGIPTVIMGAARDIVEHAGVPRFLFSDFPLGNAAGKPRDAASQAATLDLALHVLESATAPRTTVQSPQRWSDDSGWKRDFDNIETLNETDLARLRAEHERHRAIASANRTK
ncbi:MAG TPA: NUDIX domain-containing protein [Dongiaceae bacterium]|nr:NUDIX domain-containing protein [Dongiaceae bacterium]